MIDSVYPFEFYGDGRWNEKKSIASVGFLVKDGRDIVFDKGGEVVKLNFPSTITVECRAIYEIVTKHIPYFCTSLFSKSYENGRKVIVKTDNMDVYKLLHGQKPRKQNGESEELMSYLNRIRNMENDYDIRFERISSQENLAHQMCKKAEREKLCNFSKKQAQKAEQRRYYRLSIIRNF